MKNFTNSGYFGFTLLEVLVAISIFGIFSAAVWPVFNNQQRTNYNMERRTAAIQAAQSVLDKLRIENPELMPNYGNTLSDEVTVGNYNFDVVTHYCTASTHCISNSIRHISAVVWHVDEKIYEVETVYTKLR